MLKRIWLPATIGAFALLHLLQLFATLPIADRGERVADRSGEWRRVEGAALYDLADYRYQSGVRDLLTAFDSGALEPAVKARELLAASTRRAPADAYTWTMAAWADAFREDAEATARALRYSWELAPYSATLSRERLAIARTFERPLTSEERRAVARDLRVALRQHSAFARSLLRESTVMRSIAAAERLGQR